MKPRLLLIASFTVLITLGGFLDESVAGASKGEYFPGRIIVKLEDARSFQKHFLESESAKKTGKSTGAATWDLRPGDDPASILDRYMREQGVVRMNPVFRDGASARAKSVSNSVTDAARLAELAEGFERTFTITYASGKDPLELSQELSRLPGVEYAEPHFVYTVQQQGYVPNDTFIGTQGHDYFAYLNFFRAWEVTQGSPDVVIAIIDSGVYYEHPDLIGKLWRNPEPGRAAEFFSQLDWEIENDTIGWNFWEAGDVFEGEDPVQNANPIGNYSTHGTHVAGIAAADTDNGRGIAGTGFHTQFMPIKAGGTRLYPNSIGYGLHGIIYAALNDADIINCSFGGTQFSQFGRDAVDFATASGSLVVAASGNNGSDLPFYPAAYENALSVGSVTNSYNDDISNFSNYGLYVDVFAPGQQMLSTYFEYNENTVEWDPAYVRSTGTSMAAPVVSGLAALIKAEYPDWSPQRIARQIRSNARSIAGANTEPRFEHRLGKGLIDAYAALTNINPGIQILDLVFENEEGEKINIGESGVVRLSAINHGAPTSGIDLRLEALEQGITVEQSSLGGDPAGTGETFEIRFDIEIETGFQLRTPDELPLFRLDMQDASFGYSDFFMFEYERLFFDVFDVNTIRASLSSDGTIGFIDALTSSGGIGFIPGGYDNVLYEGGLMISGELLLSDSTEPIIINQVRSTTEITRHFRPVDNFRYTRQEIGVNETRLEGRASFISSDHPLADAVSVEKRAYALDGAGLDRSMFVIYEITNSGNATIENVYAGLFNDWDIRTFDNDNTAYIAEDSLIYAYDSSGPPYVTAANLGPVSSAFAIDNNSTMTLREARTRQDSLRFGINYNERQQAFDGFTDAEKRLALAAGAERTNIQNADISVVNASGPYYLPPFGTIEVGFVYAWGESVDELRQEVGRARTYYMEELFQEPERPEQLALSQNYPNPFNHTTLIRYELPEPAHVELAVYNLMGQRVRTLVDRRVEQPTNLVPFSGDRLASGIYIAALRVNGQTRTIKMTLIK
ncbi:S8 family peptidase [Balneolales bacterium ANBcel1]|nr:S8 family peptidase [Balneolales bacterium ANBcel1]